MEQSDEQAKNRSRLVEPEDLSEIGEFCHVIYVKDKNGKEKIAGSPMPAGVSSHEDILTDKVIYLNAEIKKDRLGRLRYTRVEITSSSSDYPFPKVLLAVNKLIDAYRMVSKEYWLGRISEQDILFTTRDGFGRKQCRGGPHGYSKSGTGHRQKAHQPIGRTNNKRMSYVYLGSFDARCAKSFG
jgi:hypothetical protein